MNDLRFCTATTNSNDLDFDYCSGSVFAEIDVVIPSVVTVVVSIEGIAAPLYSAEIALVVMSPSLMSDIDGVSYIEFEAELSIALTYPLSQQDMPSNVLYFNTHIIANELDFGSRYLEARILGRRSSPVTAGFFSCFGVRYSGERKHSTHNALQAIGISRLGNISNIYSKRSLTHYRRSVFAGEQRDVYARNVSSELVATDSNHIARNTKLELVTDLATLRVASPAKTQSQVRDVASAGESTDVVSADRWSKDVPLSYYKRCLVAYDKLTTSAHRIIYTVSLKPRLGRSEHPVIITPTDPTLVNIMYYHPVKSAYIFQHNFSLVKTNGAVSLRAISFSISLDYDSWTWNWSASIDPMQMSVVAETEPFEVSVTIGVSTIKLLVESYSWNRSFGSMSVSISGRGINAVLASPYVEKKTFLSTNDVNARQICDDVLAGSGWQMIDVVWGTEDYPVDWLVAGLAWSHTGTYIEALNAVAESAASYIQPDPMQHLISIKKKYPLPPWEWDTEVQNLLLIPPNAILSESWSLQQKPFYNGVWIAGGSHGGRLDKIKRLGTAGDVMAATVTDNLMTATEATRQRGVGVLSDAGTSSMVTIETPFSLTEHIITPGRFVCWFWNGSVPDTTRKGIVRSVNVSATHVKITTKIDVEINESL